MAKQSAGASAKINIGEGIARSRDAHTDSHRPTPLPNPRKIKDTGMSEREGLADRLESHVRFLAHTRVECSLAMWSNISNDVIEAAIALRAPAQSAWQPIETAPKDRFILVYCPEDNSCWLAKWQGGEWYGSDCEHGLRRTGQSLNDPDYVTGWFVSHWRFVPSLPSSDRGGVG